MRVLGRLLKYVLVLLLAAAFAVFLSLWGSLPQLEGEQIAAVEKSVTIERDALGSATLLASNRRDLAYALGFVHAQERYFQMDLLRRSAAGELAELFGARALPIDRRHRAHRFRARASAAIATLPTDQRALLTAYRDGVNYGLGSLTLRPWEYLLLRNTPRAWTEEDSVLVIYAMYFDLNGDGLNKRELNLARLKASVPESVFHFLVQPGSEWDAPLRGTALPPVPMPGADNFDLSRVALPVDYSRHATLAAEDLGLRPGSNNFAVGGALTANGAALVANDMHLNLRVPNIWFRARLRYADPADPARMIDLNGLTLPGTPALTAGSNGHIAWGFTNSYGDWMDWVRIERDPADPMRYRTPDGWEKLVRHAEVIAVNGKPQETLLVDETRWGPILARDFDDVPLALAWTAHQPRAVNLNLLQLETTGTAEQALALAPAIGMPVQNFVVGDRAGHIGWTLTGNALPRRSGYDASLPADWSRPEVGWQGFIAPADYPRLLDPAEARLWSANARTVDGDWLTLQGDGGYDLGARQLQIRDALRARERFAPADLLAIQLDDRALFLQRWQQLLAATLAANNDADLAELRQRSVRWSGRASVDAADYALVREFRQNTIKATLAPFAALARARNDDFEMPSAQGYEAAVWTLLQQRPAHLLGTGNKSWDELLLGAAREAQRVTGDKTWGERNPARITHPLSSALPGLLARFLDMPAIPLAGDHNMPRVQRLDFGASERFAIAPGFEADSYLNMPGGQSSHPLSPFHGAGHDDWVTGRPTPLLPGVAIHRLLLRPQR
ncbi:MAG: penicillin acylase family protein [Rhodanobacteraceae bacterium]|nr:penicillin acylase family protein [Rhodanobacteraceae bacterium]